MAIFERQKLHSQRPPNYDNCEPTAVKWRLLQNLATTAKRNDRETTSQKLNNCRLSCMKFCVALWLLSFQVPLGSLWYNIKNVDGTDRSNHIHACTLRCNICVYVPVCVPVCVCVSPIYPHEPAHTVGLNSRIPPHSYMTPHSRSRIRTPASNCMTYPWEELPSDTKLLRK